MQIGATDPGGEDPDQDVVVTWLGDRHILQTQTDLVAVFDQRPHVHAHTEFRAASNTSVIDVEIIEGLSVLSVTLNQHDKAARRVVCPTGR
jgi:hypothetical protein